MFWLHLTWQSRWLTALAIRSLEQLRQQLSELAVSALCLEFECPCRRVHDNGGPIAVTFTGTVEPAECQTPLP